MKCQIKDLSVHYEVYGDGHSIVILNGAGPELLAVESYVGPRVSNCIAEEPVLK
jgi:hypothetical protein